VGKVHEKGAQVCPNPTLEKRLGFSQELTEACVSFGRAFHETNANHKSTHVCRAVATELARYLLNKSLGTGKAAAPFKVFISHAKQDLELPPKSVLELRDTLAVDQPLKACVDSGDIPIGESFAQQIEDGIKASSLLVVLTDNYASREWRRTEVLLAKEHQRPIVVADALQRYEVRSFSYLSPGTRTNGVLRDFVRSYRRQLAEIASVPMAHNSGTAGLVEKMLVAFSSLRHVQNNSTKILPAPPIPKTLAEFLLRGSSNE